MLRARSAAPRARDDPSGGSADRPRRPASGSSSGRPASRPGAADRARTRPPAGRPWPRRRRGSPSSSRVGCPGQAGQPVMPGQRLRARSTAPTPREPEPQIRAISSAAVRPARPAQRQALAGPLGGGQLADGPRTRPAVTGSRVAGRFLRHGRVSVTGWLGVPGPGRREPADCSRHPNPGTLGTLAMSTHRSLVRVCTVPLWTSPGGPLGGQSPGMVSSAG